ncbi:MAG TPA: ABC transporter ATP-binding protein [Limnochordia bacterium]|nr:ABC transporter ATP-binding protein [Limnochordia bacterium]
MAQAVIEVQGVSRSYGDKLALDNVSLDVRKGEILALLGPNGAGKTTLISLMLGLRRPTTGRIRLFGGDPASPGSKTRVGAMLQETSVIPDLTVAETIDLFRSYYAEPLPTADLLDAAGLTDEAKRKGAVLSGGQKQRLAFALALAGNPELLFLDEPTVGLDVEVRRRFWERIRQIAKRTTIILTTHYLEEADALADRIVVVHQGKVMADASPRELKGSLGGRWISFAYHGEVPPLDVAALPGAERIEPGNGRLRFLSKDSDAALKLLVNHAVHDIEVRGADLEEAFLALTKE